ncbi:MAG: hypothetical protein P8Y28_06225, partial [Gammaproteobacteria bacterium]
KKSAVKKSSSKKSASVKVKKAVAKTSSTASVARSKKVSGKNIGKKVKTRTGRLIGRQGTIVRQDVCLDTYFLTFESYKNDPIYKNHEWGPYFESQLEFLKK